MLSMSLIIMKKRNLNIFLHFKATYEIASMVDKVETNNVACAIKSLKYKILECCFKSFRYYPWIS